MFLAALKAEDSLEELKSIVDKLNVDKNMIIEQKKIIERLWNIIYSEELSICTK